MKKIIFLALLFIPILARGYVFISAPPVVLVEDSFFIYVNVENVGWFNSADYSIFYNSSIFMFESLENGSINGTEIPCIYSLKEGEIKIVNDIMALNAVNGSGYLTKIKFKSLTNGSSYISIQGNISDIDGNEINISWNGMKIVSTSTCLRVEAPDRASGEFYAFLNISNVSFLNAITFDLLFDKYFVEFVEIENGSIEGSGVNLYFSEIEDGIKIVALTNASGSGCMAKIKFKGINLGPTSINMSNVTISNFYGEEIFVYLVNKTILISSSSPVAIDDYYTTDEDISLIIEAPGVLENDYDADGDTLTAVLVSNPSHGTLTLNEDGSFVYVPQANYHGSDSFTYQAYDGKDYSNIATVHITINSINDAPVANFIYEPLNPVIGQTIYFNSTSYDVDGNIVNWTWNFGDGSFAYEENTTHQYSSVGTYDVNLTVTDNLGTKSSILKQINVSKLNNPPIANDDYYSTDEDIALIVNAPGILSNDSDADNDTLAAILVSNPIHGSLTLNSNGSFIYTPFLNYHGTDSFKYKAYDGKDYSNVATVYINITPVNDVPNKPLLVTPANNSLNLSTNANLTVHVVDIDGNLMNVSFYGRKLGNVTWQLIGTKTNVANNTDTSITWYNLAYNTTYEWYAIANDSIAETSSDIWRFTTKSLVNHPPNKPALIYPTNGATDVAITLTLSWSCSDPDGSALTYDVYLGKSPDPPKLATTNSTTYTLQLAYSTTYYWRIVASDGQYENSSDTWIFTTIVYTPPSPPSPPPSPPFPPPPENKPPKCSLQVNISEGYAPLVVNFIINASDEDGYIAYWELDIDNDGITEYNGSGSPPSTKQHSYNNTGNYTAKLTVTDDKGAKAESSVMIKVIQNHKPIIKIISPENGTKTSENIIIQGFASDEDGNETIQKVEIRVDSGHWQDAEGKISWSYLLNISEFAEGEHLIYVRSFDGIDYSEEDYVKIEIVKIEKKPIYPYIILGLAISAIVILIIRKYRKVI
ncbi:MAG: tandem-95 repeat protein [Thermoplasmatales archaeon]|nr:tandem-95 repeat protein [Thermoplasmatales archaeon]